MARIKYYNPTTSSWKFADIGGEENVQSDWTQSDTTADDYIKNKPAFASVAMTGSYTDLNGRPALATIATSGTYRDLSGKPREFDEALQNAGIDITGTIGSDIFNSSSGSNGGKRMSNENYGWVFSTTRLFHKDGLVAKYATDGFDIRPFYFYAKGFKSDDYTAYGSTWAGMYVGTGEWITNCELYTPPKTFNGQEYNYVGFNLRRSDYEELSEYDINDIKNNFSVFCLKTVEEANCPILTNTTYPNGFRAGYFGATGNSSTSGDYARTHFALNIPSWAEKFVVTISGDTAFKVSAFSNIPSMTNGDSNSSYIGEWGGISTPLNTKPLVIPYNPDYYYYISAKHSRSGLTVPVVTAYAKGHCVQVDWTQSDYNAIDYIKNKPDLSAYTLSSSLAAVATSGDYNDLENKPTIPTVPVQDVQNQNGDSVVHNGIAILPSDGETYYPVELDWISDIGSAIDSYPLGWRSGYWTDTRTVDTNSNYICTAAKLRAYKDDTRYSHAFFGVAKVAVSLPENTTLVVKEWNKDDASAPTNRYDLVNGDEFPVNFNCDYGFNINVNSTYITEEYLSTIKLTMYRKTKYRAKSTEFERFTVKTNLNWANVSSTSSDNAETTNYVNRRAFIALPDTYSATGKPTPVIMLSHGASGHITGAQINSDNEYNLALIRAFTSAGYAVFDVDNTRENSGGWHDWGCLPLVTEYINAWRHIVLTYNVDSLLNIYSLSMGTAAALNILKWKPFPVKSVAMSAPRPICETRYNDLTSTDKAEMASAFGLSGTTWEQDRLKGFNQYENKITIGNTEYILENFPEIKVLVGQNDTDYLTETRAYYAALQNAGNYVNYREIENASHVDVCFLRLGGMKQEVINWFDRFNK